MENKSDITGFILAGGKSRRMGTNKAFLMFQNVPLLKHMIMLIEPVCHEVFVSGRATGYDVFNVPIIPDLFSDCGPIAGIYSSLNHSESDWNLLVSVDVPFVNEELFRHLILHSGESDCIIPKHASGVEPLVGLYHRRILPVVEEMIGNGDYKLMDLLARLNTRFLDCNDLVTKYPRLFLNVNCPEDYRSI